MNANTVEKAVEAIQHGRFVIVTDDEDRENEGDLIGAAEDVSEESIAFMLRHTSGIICVPMLEDRLERLQMPQMVNSNSENFRTAFSVSVDAIEGVTTGVSAADRALTIRALANDRYAANDFVRPGHVFPLRYKNGGVLVRAGHTEATIDLVEMAGKKPVGILCELMNQDGTMMRSKSLTEFANTWDIPIVSIDSLIQYRRAVEKSITEISRKRVSTAYGDMLCVEYDTVSEGGSATTLIKGDPVRDPPLVRVQASCHFLDSVLFDEECHCSKNLRQALAMIEKEKSGVLVVLGNNNERPSISHGATSSAQESQPSTQMWRDIGIGSQILADLGVRKMKVLETQALQYPALESYGLSIIERVALSDAGKETKLQSVRGGKKD